jgi:hypothetical protein
MRNLNYFNNLHMIASTDGRLFICSFCSVFRTLLHYVSHKIPALFPRPEDFQTFYSPGLETTIVPAMRS